MAVSANINEALNTEERAGRLPIGLVLGRTLYRALCDEVDGRPNAAAVLVDDPSVPLVFGLPALVVDDPWRLRVIV